MRGRARARGLAAAALLCLLARASAWAEPAASAAPAPTLGERIAAIAALGPRTEGSAGEAAAFAYVEASLRAAGLQSRSSDFSDAEGDYSASRIVEAVVPGAREDELAVIVPLSSWVGASDSSEGAYGLALALDEAARVSGEREAGLPCPITLRFVFLGAEKRGIMREGDEASLGSRTWIARQAGRTRLAALYLNLGSPPSRILVRGAGRGVLSPYWYYQGARRALMLSGIEFNLEANRLQAYRLGLAADYGPTAPYLEAGIPALELRGQSGRAASGSEPWLANFVAVFAKAEGGGFKESWDRHYFIFQIGGLSAVLQEGSYVAFLVVALALVASSFLIATVARRRASLQILRRIPAFAAEVIALFAALALVFLAGKGIARIDAALLGSADAWRLAPRLFVSARVLFSFLLFLALLSFLVEKRVLTPNPYFYEFAALACLAVDSLVFSAVDLSTSFYFIWALVLVEISLALRKRWATLVAYLLMYLPLLVVAGELAARPELATYAGIIEPGYLGVLALSALTLPFFVFTASPLLFYARRGAAARKRAVALFAASALALEASALAYVLFSPASGPRRGELSVSESIDQDKGEFEIELAGFRRLGEGSLARGGTRLDYDSKGDRARLGGVDLVKRIGVTERDSPFLDRVDEAVAIDFATAPYSVDLALESSAEILIYDCRFPYKVAVDGKSAVIYTGVNPGRLLGLSLTVPASFGATLVVTAHYLSSLEPYAQSSRSPLSDSGLSVKASFAIGSRKP